MKRFRISFLAVLAVLAIGLTAATKADVFKKPATAYDCRLNVDYINGEFKLIAAGVASPAIQHWNDDYNFPFGSRLCPGEGLYCLKLSTPPQKATEDFECTEGTDEFCCAEVLPTSESDVPCGTNPFGAEDYTGFNEKVRIYCKTDDIDPN